MWLSYRDANLSPFGEICHFETKIGDLHDLCSSDDVLKMGGRVWVSEDRLAGNVWTA